MKIDLYTKVILTVIAIGIGCLVFEQKPVKEAQAAGNLEQRVAKLEQGRKELGRYKGLCKKDGVRINKGVKTTDLYHALIRTYNQDKLAWLSSRARVSSCLELHSWAIDALALK